jgi:hypothetical protein
MTKNKKSILMILISLPIIAFVLSVIQQVVVIMKGTNPLWIGYIASILITLGTFLFRYVYADVDQLSKTLQESGGSTDNQLKPRRFLNVLPYAMLVGVGATIAIHQEFIVGMGLYFVMQILLIIAFSGIINLKFKTLFSKEKRVVTIIIVGFWLVYMLTVFPFLILPGLLDEPVMAILVSLYVLSLIMMGLIAFLQLPYRKRSLGLRIAMALGATSFIFSDTLIGYTAFVQDFTNSSVLIQPTYVLAIALISAAILFQIGKRKTT